MKKVYLLHCLSVFFMLSVMGCATVGKEFNYSARTQLLLGKTPIDEAKQLFGEPKSKKLESVKDHQFEQLTYSYAIATSGTNVRMRHLTIEFRDKVLSGMQYISTYEEDTTAFDTDKSSQIKRGISNKHDVENIMGTSSGKFMCPSALGGKKCDHGTEGWIWSYIYRESNKAKKDILIVTFNEDEVVTDVWLLAGN